MVKDKSILQAPAYIDSASTLKDGTIKLAVYTNRELPADEMTKLFKLVKKVGWFMFAQEVESFDNVDIPELPKGFTGEKSKGQRLRSVLFILWQTLGKVGNFDDFYNTRMERFIDEIKANIEELTN